MDALAFTRLVQSRLGVTADGVVGPVTLSALDKALPPKAQESHSLKNPQAFFQGAKAVTGSLTQGQVDGFNVLLEAMKAWPVSWVAYGLATAFHETAATMQPIKEMGGEAYFRRMYDIQGERPQKARELGNLNPGDGARYAGRGYVQLTGRHNYARYGLENNPDAAMQADVAAEILVDGMSKGAFTGKKLSDYLPGDYVNARRIINGLDVAQKIAGYAKKFESALIAGGW